MGDELPPRRLPQFTVVHKPRVAVRSEPATSASMVATKVTGAVVTAKKEAGGWIELDGEPGWMLIDGASVKLGMLLERVPVPDTPLTLKFAHPTTVRPTSNGRAAVERMLSDGRCVRIVADVG